MRASFAQWHDLKFTPTLEGVLAGLWPQSVPVAVLGSGLLLCLSHGVATRSEFPFFLLQLVHQVLQAHHVLPSQRKPDLVLASAAPCFSELPLVENISKTQPAPCWVVLF